MFGELEALLHLDRKIIGVKRLSADDMSVYHALDFEQVKHKAYYCWLVKKATEGRAFKCTFDQFACETAGWVLGLAPWDHFGTHDENVEAWYACGTYQSKQVAERIHKGIQPLATSKAILVGPLEAFPPYIKPDVAIIIGKPYTLMRIVQSYSACHGFASQIKMSGMCGICFESTAQPLQTQSLSLSTLCSGTRFYAKWASDEMSASLPYDHLQDLLEGAHLTLNPCEPDTRKIMIKNRLQSPASVKLKDNYFIRKG